MKNIMKNNQWLSLLLMLIVAGSSAAFASSQGQLNACCAGNAPCCSEMADCC